MVSERTSFSINPIKKAKYRQTRCKILTFFQEFTKPKWQIRLSLPLSTLLCGVLTQSSESIENAKSKAEMEFVVEFSFCFEELVSDLIKTLCKKAS